MSDMSTRWPQLYREAILESDRDVLPSRIKLAQRAIRARVHELWYAASPETRERHDLDAAARFLGLLEVRHRRPQ